MTQLLPMVDDDKTDEVVSQCAWCPGMSTRLIDCEPPRFDVLPDKCIYSGSRVDIHGRPARPRWEWCGVMREFRATL